jgi:hypothetical protein
MGKPPSVARTLLAREFRQATAKRHFEHSQTQFPAGCCRNNTWPRPLQDSICNVESPPRTRLRTLSQAFGWRRHLYLFQAIPGLTLDRPPLVPGRRRRRRRQPKRRFEPKPLMPRAWGKPRRSPAIPRHRFCRGSGRPGHQTGRPKAGAGGIDGNKRCLTRKAEVKRPALHLQCRSAWRACRASSFRPHQLGAKDWRRGRDSNP